ncbi:hypothetical protein [Natronoglycomyces albus]|uniref:Uncharacterized protein n=1 Tax=Natronoglycomyces albus TaxID=2811108 RepID=A0A895XQX8_9ACTN|nr:hypothetical protein [Natronoglycomyces albus]QSB05565.1 hypothetical protein JQS30_01080 [Natronoglycomyces albus]
MSRRQDSTGATEDPTNEVSEFDRVDRSIELDADTPADPEVAIDDAEGQVPAETNPADAADQAQEVPALAEDEESEQ